MAGYTTESVAILAVCTVVFVTMLLRAVRLDEDEELIGRFESLLWAVDAQTHTARRLLIGVPSAFSLLLLAPFWVAIVQCRV